jgi:long-subunit fatty acid transport protein
MNTKRNYLWAVLLTVGFGSQAQNYAGDVFRFSQTNQPSGTARMRALGGTQIALGADASALTSNPAGLGFYTKSEFSFGLDYNLRNNDARYLGTKTTATDNNLGLSNLSVVLGNRRDASQSSSGWKPATWAFGYNNQHSFRNTFSYNGLNKSHSITDSYAEEANAAGYSPDDLISSDLFDQNRNRAYNLAALYYNSWLIEGDDKTQTYKRFDYLDPSAAEQRGVVTTTGKTSQWSVGVSTSYQNKLYLGASASANNLRYSFRNNYSESFTKTPLLRSMNSEQYLEVEGSGLQFNLGLVYRPIDALRVAVSYQSPTNYLLSENYEEFLDAESNPSNKAGIPSNIAGLDLASQYFDYEIRTPAKINTGAVIMLGKKGLVTANAEFVKNNRMSAGSESLDPQDNADFSSATNNALAQDYKNVINLRLGAELRQNRLYLRGGLALLPDQYKYSDGIDRDQLVLSAGVGLRGKKSYLDLSAQSNTYDSAFSPYSLNDASRNSSVLITNKNTTITASLGFFF